MADRTIIVYLQLKLQEWTAGWSQAKQQASSALQQTQADAAKVGTETEAAAKKGQNALSNMTTGASSGMANLIKAAATMAAAYVGINTIKGAVDATQEYADTVFKIQQVSGMSAEASSHFAEAIKEAGIDVDNASTMLARFEKNMFNIQVANEDGSTPSKTTSQLLKDIGISATDAAGNMRPVSDLLEDLADKFSQSNDAAMKTAVAMNLFGKSGASMIPLLNMGKQGLEEAAAACDKYGLTLSGDNLAKMHQYTLDQRSMGEAILGVKMQIGEALMPWLDKLMKWFTDNQPAIRSFVDDALSKIGTAVSDMATMIQKAMPVLQNSAKIISDGFNAVKPGLQWVMDNKVACAAAFTAIGVAMLLAFTPVTVPILAVVTAIGVLLVAVDFLKKPWDQLTSFVKEHINVLKTLAIALAIPLAPIITLIAAIVLLIKYWGDIKAAISDVIDFVNTYLPFLVIPFQMAFDNIKAVVTFTFDEIKNYLSTIFAVYGHIFDAGMALLKGNWKGAWNDIKQVPITALNGLGQALSSVINLIIDLINGMIGGINSVASPLSGVISAVTGGHVDLSIHPITWRASFGAGGGGGGAGGGTNNWSAVEVAGDVGLLANRATNVQAAAWAGAAGGVPSPLGATGESGADISGALGGAAAATTTAAYNLGQAMINLSNAVTKFVDPVADAFQHFAWSWRTSGLAWADFISKTFQQTVPHLAVGIADFAGGLAKVGERGPELAWMPAGTNVYPAPDTAAILAGVGNNQRGGVANINNEFNLSVVGNTYEQVRDRLIKTFDDAAATAGIRAPLTTGGVGLPRL